MDNSRIEVYKIICGNKTFRQIAIEKNEGIDQANDNEVFNSIFFLFLRALTCREVFSTNNTKLGLTLFHSNGEDPNKILSSHSNTQIIEGFVDGGPYDRLRKISERNNTTEFSIEEETIDIKDKFKETDI